MYELNVSSRKQLERATLRAQAEKLHFEEVIHGIYRVTGSKGDKYLVGIEANPAGGYDCCCSCKTTAPNTCKHLSTVFPWYLMREREFKAEEARMAAAAPTFAQIVSEIREIVTATETTLAEYTEAQAEYDCSCLFG